MQTSSSSRKAVKLGLHTNEQALFNATFRDMKLQNPSVLEKTKSAPTELLKNKCVQAILEETKRALAYQEQVVDIHRSAMEGYAIN
eukprot:scaffold661654_cov57-Prasinocladus_malaysianus.AAC.2